MEKKDQKKKKSTDPQLVDRVDDEDTLEELGEGLADIPRSSAFGGFSSSPSADDHDDSDDDFD